jgi:hypothetical protein
VEIPESYRFGSCQLCLGAPQLVLIALGQSSIALFKVTCLLILALRCQVHPRPSIWAIEVCAVKVSADFAASYSREQRTARSRSIWRCQDLSVGIMQEVLCNLHSTFRLTYSSRNCTLLHQAQHFYIYWYPGTSSW